LLTTRSFGSTLKIKIYNKALPLDAWVSGRPLGGGFTVKKPLKREEIQCSSFHLTMQDGLKIATSYAETA
jgi:hypothetical protein